MHDRVDRRAFVISTLLHAALVAAAFWQVQSTNEPIVHENLTPAPLPAPDAEAPSLTRIPEADAPTEAPPELPPVELDELPPLELGERLRDAIRPHEHSAAAAERTSRGDGDEGLGAASELPAAGQASAMVDRLAERARDADPEVDRELAQWQLADAFFTNRLREQWRLAWRERYGKRLRSAGLRIWIDIDDQDRVVRARIAEGQGSGIDELDRRIEFWVADRYRRGDAISLPPIDSEQRRQLFYVPLR